MPTYKFEDTNTGEVFEKFMKMSEKDEYLEQNPNLKSVIGAPMIVSGVGSTISKTDGGWKEVLGKIKAGSGQGNTIKTK